jgi:lipopolysaccharide export system permease protein
VIRTVERYVLSELLRTFALVLLAITFIFFLGTAFRLIRDELTYWQILRSLPYAVPYTLPYSLPMAFLIAVTLTYGRLVADREVLALESCGVPPRALAPPAIAMGVVLCLASMVLQSSFIPYCHQKKAAIGRAMLEELLSLGEGEHLSRVFPRDGFDIYVRKHRYHALDGVVIHRDVEDQPMTIVAEHGDVAYVGSEEGQQRLVLELSNVTTTVWTRDRKTHAAHDPVRAHSKSYTLEVPSASSFRVKVGDLSTPQLRELVTRERDARRFGAAVGMISGALIATDQRLDDVPVEIATRAAVATAPLVFLAIGLPLTIALRHPNRLVPFVSGTAAVSLFYFVPLLLGRTLAESGAGTIYCFTGPVVGLVASLGIAPLAARIRS